MERHFLSSIAGEGAEGFEMAEVLTPRLERAIGEIGEDRIGEPAHDRDPRAAIGERRSGLKAGPDMNGRGGNGRSGGPQKLAAIHASSVAG